MSKMAVVKNEAKLVDQATQTYVTFAGNNTSLAALTADQRNTTLKTVPYHTDLDFVKSAAPKVSIHTTAYTRTELNTNEF
jgi:hypothetical protein